MTQMSLTNNKLKPYNLEALGNDNIMIETQTQHLPLVDNKKRQFLISKKCLYNLEKFVVRGEDYLSYSCWYKTGNSGGGNIFLSKECYDNLVKLGVPQNKGMATDEELQKEIDENKYYKEHYSDGACSVWFEDGVYYFKGDIEHLGKDNIFKNAREMLKQMKEKKCKYSHKNFDDSPTFNKSYNKEEKEATERDIKYYEDDVYMFCENEIVIFIDNGETSLREAREKNTDICKNCGGVMKCEKDDDTYNVFWLECEKCQATKGNLRNKGGIKK